MRGLKFGEKWCEVGLFALSLSLAGKESLGSPMLRSDVGEEGKCSWISPAISVF